MPSSQLSEGRRVYVQAQNVKPWQAAPHASPTQLSRDTLQRTFQQWETRQTSSGRSYRQSQSTAPTTAHCSGGPRGVPCVRRPHRRHKLNGAFERDHPGVKGQRTHVGAVPSLNPMRLLGPGRRAHLEGALERIHPGSAASAYISAPVSSSGQRAARYTSGASANLRVSARSTLSLDAASSAQNTQS